MNRVALQRTKEEAERATNEAQRAKADAQAARESEAVTKRKQGAQGHVTALPGPKQQAKNQWTSLLGASSELEGLWPLREYTFFDTFALSFLGGAEFSYPEVHYP